MDVQQIEIRVIPLQKYWGKEEEFYSFLDAQEKKRADRFTFAELRRNYLLAHGLLRLELAGYLAIDPSAIVYCYGPYGKPFLASGEMHFNMSHSNNRVLFGFSRDVEIGVDIEYMKPSLMLEDLPVSVLTTAEQELIRLQPDGRRKEVFYQIWTRKEAYYKAIGTGLQDGFANRQVALEWRFHEAYRTAEYISSIAYRDPRQQIVVKNVVT